MIIPLFKGSTARSAVAFHLSPILILSFGKVGKLLKEGNPLSSIIVKFPSSEIVKEEGIASFIPKVTSKEFRFVFSKT